MGCIRKFDRRQVEKLSLKICKAGQVTARLFLYVCNIAMYDEKRKAYDMYATSHYIDPAKAADVRNKRAIVMRIKGASGLSTVYNYARKKNVHGQRFRNLNNMEIVGQLTPYQEKRFKAFLEKSKQKSKFRKK